MHIRLVIITVEKGDIHHHNLYMTHPLLSKHLFPFV